MVKISQTATTIIKSMTTIKATQKQQSINDNSNNNKSSKTTTTTMKTMNREQDDGSTSSCQTQSDPGLRGANNKVISSTERGRVYLAVNH